MKLAKHCCVSACVAFLKYRLIRCGSTISCKSKSSLILSSMNPVTQPIRGLRHPGKLSVAVTLTIHEILRSRLDLSEVMPSERIRAQKRFISHLIIHQVELRTQSIEQDPVMLLIFFFAWMLAQGPLAQWLLQRRGSTQLPSEEQCSA